MEELIKKVSEEKQALEERLKKLHRFMKGEKYKKLSEKMKDLLYRQTWHMHSYRDILADRIRLMEEDLSLSYTD